MKDPPEPTSPPLVRPSLPFSYPFQVLSTHGSDVAVTPIAESTPDPAASEAPVYLYVEDVANACFRVAVHDRKSLGEDALLGQAERPLAELCKDGAWEGWIDVMDSEGASQGSVEVALRLLPLEGEGASDKEKVPGRAGREKQEGGKEGGKGKEPTKAVVELDWDVLASKIRGGEVGGMGAYALAAFLSNSETDTQGAIWENQKDKELVICFRGTEIGWKDLLTDAMILQQPLDDTRREDPRRVHAGFLRAFRAVKDAVYTALHFVRHGDLDGWKIDVCGHSLGGALATLLAHDLADRYPEMAASGRLQMYCYGEWGGEEGRSCFFWSF